MQFRISSLSLGLSENFSGFNRAGRTKAYNHRHSINGLDNFLTCELCLVPDGIRTHDGDGLVITKLIPLPLDHRY